VKNGVLQQDVARECQHFCRDRDLDPTKTSLPRKLGVPPGSLNLRAPKRFYKNDGPEILLK
jgi:hypothetical protein